ncbi:hypothetical protein FRB90_004716 [Tulasnella sp. 427]|nr:hypothetical protein FRB90_004716 [Tulasnella sp. 427]
MANGLKGRGRTEEQALKERGERGIRIGHLEYKNGFLELGMLSGNCFVITLRNLRVDAPETVNEVMQSIKTKGFINYYGMQRFGTASIPTHAIGLAILKSDWALAISLLLRPRPGEHTEIEAGRRAFLEEGNLSRALDLIPRRCVAERCILEYYQKSKGRNALEALSTIPRNLRLMYVHAYQSYVWNVVVSERVREHGCEKPVFDDLVYDNDPRENTGMDVDATPGDKGKKPQRGGKRPYVAPKIKVLSTEEDLKSYTIFDVIMPLPGRDVAYPGGQLGERYKEFLRLDGLDPDNLIHAQKDYTLLGSYRKIMHLPAQLSWSTLRYTDPDIALAQSDEDKILGFDPPVVEEHGRFMALQIQLQLGTAAYATMAIREITKMDTSSQTQAVLTQRSEDQKFKGGNEPAVEVEGEGEDAEVPVAEDEDEMLDA